MFRFDRAALLFSLNSFAAAMLALYIGFAIGLPRPYWAMTTAYIVSQPLSGAVRSKAVYRIIGTLVGAAAAVALVPNLVNSPLLLSAALALWVGACLTVSLLDRTPRSYLLMLAGYTAAIIGFPAVNQPGAVFEIAVTRVIEIGLGIGCATLVHSLVFPQPVGDAIRRRLEVWLADADRWALDILRARDSAKAAADRRHLAAAASEIQILSIHLPFDTSRLRETTSAVRALHERTLLLIPLLSGLADRMAALADVADSEAREALDTVADWIEAGADRQAGLGLAARIEALATGLARQDWSGLLVESLLMRLADLVAALSESHALMRCLAHPDAALDPALQAAVAHASRQKMHNDPPLALLSGTACAVAILRPMDRHGLGRRGQRGGDGRGVLLLLRGHGRPRPGHRQFRRLLPVRPAIGGALRLRHPAGDRWFSHAGRRHGAPAAVPGRLHPQSEIRRLGPGGDHGLLQRPDPAGDLHRRPRQFPQ
jgi:uncharacterized membrane protein YccC